MYEHILIALTLGGTIRISYNFKPLKRAPVASEGHTRRNTMDIYIMSNIYSEEYSNRIICQQVNCQGKMGSGLAKAIKDRYPQVYTQYMQDHKDGLLNLGYVSYIDVGDNNVVANICSQEYYGYDGKQYTDYDAIHVGLTDVFDTAREKGYDVVIPYKIGCGLGGGDWEVVKEMIIEVFNKDGNSFYS